MTAEQITSEHAPRREHLITRGVLPLVIEATEGHDISVFLDEVRMLIESHLFVQGALLFRGFPITSHADFTAFVTALSPQLLDYDFGSTPRTHLGGKIYTSLTVEFPWQEGDVLMLGNILVAHGRTPYTGERKVLVAMAEAYSQLRGSR